MPKKIEILETILHSLNGGDSVADTQSRYHPSIVGEAIADIYGQLLTTNVTKAMSAPSDSFALDNYTKTFTSVPVEYDNVRCEYFSDLPAEIVSLPFQSGVRFISPIHDQSYQFLPRSNNSVGMFSELEVSQTENMPRFYVENGRVYYEFHGDEFKKVLMKLVPTFTGLEDFDEVEMPGIMGREGYFSLHDLVVRRFLSMPPEDLSNDTNPKQI